jgi:hypothetical protein
MLEYKNKKYARVTDILGSHYVYKDILDDVLEKKAKLGQNVHQAIDDYLQGKIPMLKKKEQPYFTSFRLWKEALNPQYIHREKRLYDDELRITGQIDAAIMIPGEKLPMIVDYKCVPKKMITWRYQGHFYHLLATRNKYRIGNRFMFVFLKADGSMAHTTSFITHDIITENCIQMAKKFWKDIPKNLN